MRERPSPQTQVEWLGKLQRLFAEGDFAATYKFALLISLADLAVEFGSDDGEELVLKLHAIAERFVDIYWRQAVPYSGICSDSHTGILVQNRGAQAAVVSAICAFRDKTGATNAQQAALMPGYSDLIRRVARTVSDQPIRYVQNFGGVTDEFLFRRAGSGAIALKPGIAFFLRRFQPLVQELARSRWVEHIKSNRRNGSILGRSDDLQTFLFNSPRRSLEIVAKELREIDGSMCFYCRQTVHEVDIDHFIPLSRYPRDLAENFVLTHPHCNRSKSDMLAGRRHLENWLARLDTRGRAIQELGQKAGVISDARACKRVARWAYSNAHETGGRAWLAAKTFEAIDASHVRLLD